MAIAALLGSVLGAWLANRRRSLDPQAAAGLRDLSTLVEQSAKSIGENVERIRGAVIDSERATGANLSEGLKQGFDSSLATITEGSKAQTSQIETFRSEVMGLSASVAGLRTEMPAAFQAAEDRARLSAVETQKALLEGLIAPLRQYSIDQTARLDAFGAKMEASGTAVTKSITDFQAAVAERLGEVKTVVTRFGGEVTTTLAENQTRTAKALTEEFTKLTSQIDAKITELRTGNEEKLLAIQGVVDQKLQEGIEKRMTESFARITAQFAEVQQAVGEVKIVAGQVGDLKRLFSNVKSRGGWGESQVRNILDDILPPNSYETNKCVNPATSDTVEFALRLPVQGGAPVYLAVDAKFPVEDYSRLMDAADIGDPAAERAARTSLEARIRQEARKIQTKYIAPPYTVEWAILFVPSEGLYSEIARSNDLIEAVQRENRIVIMGPSMLAVMLRTIQLGHYTLAISQKADVIGQILGAVKHEMVDFGKQFQLLEKNVQVLGNNIRRGRTRANVITRKLRDVAALDGPASATILEFDDGDELRGSDADEDEPGTNDAIVDDVVSG
jgi:DNA recombination protein RmuC